MPFTFLMMLFILYGIQGIPYGIQSRFLPIYLRSQNFSLTVLGLIKLLYIPWILKTFYAPFIDSMWTKINWLKLSIFFLFLTSLFISIISITSPSALFIGLFCLNFFSATQDIALDGIMIAELSSKDLTLGNIAQVVGYKLGAVVGGGFLLFLSFYFQWFHLFIIVSIIYFCAFISTFLLKQVIVPKSKQLQNVCEKKNMREKGIRTYGETLRDCVINKGTKTMVGLVLIYKLSEQGSLTLLPLFLYDNSHSLRAIGLWTGIIGQFSSVLGSSAAVFVSKYEGSWKILYSLSIISIPVHIILIILVSGFQSGDSLYFGISVFIMNVLLLISGVRTTVTFSLMMKCSQAALSSIQSTHYTLLATMEVLGKLIFSSIVGIFTDYFGYFNSYCLFLVLSIVTLYYLRHNREELLTIESFSDSNNVK